jgi:hypothetical protein
MLIYIEYFSRRPGVDLVDFQRTVTSAQDEWSTGYSADQLIIRAGRTWRLGPEPEYFCVWSTPNAGLERIDAWDREFRTPQGIEHAAQFARVARIDIAGCYRPLMQPIPSRNGIYYAEFFRSGAGQQGIRAMYEDRARRHQDLTLNLLIQRIGGLAPDPGGLAMWTVPSFSMVESIATEFQADGQTLTPVAAGTYVDIGREIL